MDMLIFFLKPHKITSFLGIIHPFLHLSRPGPGTEQALKHVRCQYFTMDYFLLAEDGESLQYSHPELLILLKTMNQLWQIFHLIAWSAHFSQFDYNASLIGPCFNLRLSHLRSRSILLSFLPK